MPNTVSKGFATAMPFELAYQDDSNDIACCITSNLFVFKSASLNLALLLDPGLVSYFILTSFFDALALSHWPESHT